MDKHYVQNTIQILLLLILSILISFAALNAQTKEKLSKSQQSNLSTVKYSKFNINNISTFIFNNGIADAAPYPGPYSGFQFPNGSGKICVTNTGFLWAGKVDDKISSGGSSFRSGLTPGKILANGLAEDSNAPNVRVYRVRRDYKDADLQKEAADEGKTTQEIFSQYEKDWNEWPAIDGAPYEDKNLDSIFNPQIDIPGVPGADQTLWFVANDLDSNKTKELFGSLPMGIELQVTIWGYNQENSLGNALFKRYVIINKSNKQFTDMHVGIWSDIDVSARRIDLAGCDTTLNLGYIFGTDSDDPQYEEFSPAVGFSLLQGPIVSGNSSDQAIFLGKKIKGKKNLGFSAFAYTTNGNAGFMDPRLGQYSGTIELNNLLQGKRLTGELWQIPELMGGGTTKYPLSGDYLRRTGFYDGVQTPSSDRRMLMSSGSFNMAPGDTQEVVFAELAAGADGGANNLTAVALLKFNTYSLRGAYFWSPPITINQTKPIVSVTNFDGEILLDWGEDLNQINKIESGDSIYKFEGYNIYQFPSADSKFNEAKLVATYDLFNGITKIVSFDFNPLTQSYTTTIRLNGSDSGIKRHISIKNDLFRNQPLVNWNEYYFGVTQYSYSTSNLALTNYRESSTNIYKAIPQPIQPGLINEKNVGSGINVFHHAGSFSTSTVTASVVDPTKLTNSEYEITFQIKNNIPFFTVKNLTTAKTILFEQTIPYHKEDIPLVEGVLLKIFNSTSRPFTANDVYRFQTIGSSFDKNIEEESFDKINVFPNPFYGTTKNELFNYDNFINFTHLPVRAIFRIFNIAGQLVRKFEKDSSERIIRWDLKNDSGVTLPSGLYIAHIELPDFGKVKILKIAIIQQ